MKTKTSPLIEKAKVFCEDCHDGQKRKFSGNPYEVHPKNVARVLRNFTDDGEIIASGYLHDVVEDSELTIEGVRASFTDRVANIVDELTNDSEAIELEYIGKTYYMCDKIWNMSDDALLVKLADRYDNVKDLNNQVPDNFRKKYSKETLSILFVLQFKNLNKNHCELVNKIETLIPTME